MSIACRGRGWAQNDKNQLPRPGTQLHSEDTNYVNFVNIIKLVNDENLSEKIEEVLTLFNEKGNKQNLKDVHNKLYKYALNDREFGLKLLMVYNCPSIKNICDSEDMSLFKYLVRCLQDDYERRKSLRKENMVQFHNAVCLFSKFLSYIIKSPWEFLKFQSALLDYMEMLLETASERDINVFTEQVVVHGKRFQNNYKEKIDSLMITVRQILVKENISLASRYMLLYIIDLENRNFNPLPKNLQIFYELQLGKNLIPKDNEIINSLPNPENEHDSSKNSLSDQKHQSVLTNNRGLRAIRGSGAVDVAK